MRKFILSAVMCLFALTAFSQNPARHRMHFRHIYTVVDTLVLENFPTPYPTKDGDYLIELNRNHTFVVAYNKDHSKAIVLQGYPWGKKMEFNVKNDEYRLILYYKDEYVYCAYIYDRRVKACQYVEAINEREKEKLVKLFPFLKRMSTFTDAENNSGD